MVVHPVSIRWEVGPVDLVALVVHLVDPVAQEDLVAHHSTMVPPRAGVDSTRSGNRDRATRATPANRTQCKLTLRPDSQTTLFSGQNITAPLECTAKLI